MATIDQSVQIPLHVIDNPMEMKSKILNDKAQPLSIYEFLNTVSKNYLVFYIIVIISVAILFSHFTIKTNTIIGIAVGVAFAWFHIDKTRITKDHDFLILEEKMNALVPIPKFFYIDANIIDLMYNLIEFSEWAPNDFSEVIQHVDNVLQLQIDIENGMSDCSQDLDVMNDEIDSAIDTLKGILIAIPANSIELKDKLVSGIETLDKFLTRHFLLCQKLCGSIKKV